MLPEPAIGTVQKLGVKPGRLPDVGHTNGGIPTLHSFSAGPRRPAPPTSGRSRAYQEGFSFVLASYLSEFGLTPAARSKVEARGTAGPDLDRYFGQ